MTDFAGESLANQLLAVEEAIQRCMISQSHTIRGREQKLAELKELRILRKEIKAEVQEATNGGSMISLGVRTNSTI